VSAGGCTYCNNNAFNPSYCTPDKSITQQLSEGVEFHQVRYRKVKNYLAYFQAYSNTHAPLDKLRTLYEEALQFPGVIGLVIGTRPDCVDNEKLDYLSMLAEKYHITIEYGIESIYNKTLERINRGHTFELSVSIIKETSKRGINTGAHLIIGLPGESEQEILNSMETISQLPLTTVKFHQLQIIKNTFMEKEFNKDPSAFHLYGLDDYLELMVKVIEKLNPAFVIERIAGEVPPWYLAGPSWGLLRVADVVRAFESKLKDHDTWQGRLYKKLPIQEIV
jgi:radical SAM protein (TIGR01212 family)